MLRRIRIISAVMCCTLLGASMAEAQETISRYHLIPYPQELTPQTGAFTITRNTRLVLPADTRRFFNETAQLQSLIAQGLGTTLSTTTKPAAGAIVLKQDPQLPGEEDYTLHVSAQQLLITAKTPAGIFRAVETIRQLLPSAIEGLCTGSMSKLEVPAVIIKDHPAFAWRGMHLDVSRHFFSVDYLKKFIDLLALYKMNKLHLHLSDDQGWRIEIKKYPLLTEQGAWREFNSQDSVCMSKAKENHDFEIDPQHIIHKDGKTLYGGFYTQAQMRDVIAYAADRHIEIIPEIDMPGHMMAAIKAYPYLACSAETGWGKTFSTPICPCNESTFKFAEDVYTEIAALFPSPYMHLGADEVEKSSWAQSAACQDLMRAQHIRNVEELQSYLAPSWMVISTFLKRAFTVSISPAMMAVSCISAAMKW